MVRNRNSSKLVTTELLNSINSSLEHSDISSKSKYRYLIARSEQFEKQMSELLQALSLYTRRNAKLRDSGDNVSKAIDSISQREVLSLSMKKNLGEVANSFRNIQDHRDSEVVYLEDQLLKQFADLAAKVHRQREELRSKTTKLSDTRGRGWMKSSINQNSNTKLSATRRRSQSAERSAKPSKEERILQRSIQTLEYRRNVHLKGLVLKMILSELRFTIKSMNCLTSLYRSVSKHIHPDEDLQLFSEFFNFPSLSQKLLHEMNEDGDEAEDIEQSDGEDEDEDESEGEDESDEEELKDGRDGFDKRSNRSKVSLRRFNSSPEISDELEQSKAKQPKQNKKHGKSLNNSILTSNPNQSNTTSSKLIRNKLFKPKNTKASREETSESDEDDSEETDESDDDENDRKDKPNDETNKKSNKK